MPAFSSHSSHSQKNVMEIFRTLGSRSLSVIAILIFSGKTHTAIHGLSEEDTATLVWLARHVTLTVTAQTTQHVHMGHLNTGSMLGQRLRRWRSFEPVLGERVAWTRLLGIYS